MKKHLFLRLTGTTIFLVFNFASLWAQEAAISGFNTDSPDGFALLLLRDYGVGDTIFITDMDYNPATNSFTDVSSDIVIRYTVPAGGLTKGTVVTIQNATNPNDPMLVSSGTVTLFGSGTIFGFNGGEPLSVFSASNSSDPLNSIVEIFGYYHSGGSCDSVPSADGDCPCSTNFVLIDYCGQASSIDGAQYTGSRINTTFAQFTNLANWTTSDSHISLNSTPFTNIQFGTEPVGCSTPSAVCSDFIVQLNVSGAGTVTPDDIDGGSSVDPNCLPLIKTIIGQTSFNCSNIGNHTLTLKVTDNSNNEHTCSATVTVTDDIPPVALCQNQTINLDASGMGSVTAAQVDNGSNDACNLASLNGLVLDNGSFTCSEVGNNSVVLTVTDVNGNQSTCSSTIMVDDATPPVALCQNQTVNLDASGMGSVTAAQVDNGSNDACNLASLNGLVLDNGSFTCSEVGNNSVVLTVTDMNGNQSTCSSTIMVDDAIPPVALCQNQTVNLDASGMGNVTAAQVDNGSNDACNLASLNGLVLDNGSFTCSEVGNNSVVLTVTDMNGNQSTCSSTIMVDDAIPPVALCQNQTVNLDASGMGNVTAAQVDNGSNDACNLASLNGLVLDNGSFTCSEVGNNSVVLTVTDVNGNQSTCSATVTVTPPSGVNFELASSSKLWPPNYDYETFTIAQMLVSLSDNCGGNLSLNDVWIASASSDELEDALGTQDGKTLNDMVIASDCRSVQLRRERAGTDNGRVYTITLAIKDPSGNIIFADYIVTVPKWAWGFDSQVQDDGSMYSVSCSPN